MKKSLVLLFLLLTTIALAQQEQDSIATQLETVTVSENIRSITNKKGNIKIDVANSVYKLIKKINL